LSTKSETASANDHEPRESRGPVRNTGDWLTPTISRNSSRTPGFPDRRFVDEGRTDGAGEYSEHRGRSRLVLTKE
jgi:hypothetical protein